MVASIAFGTATPGGSVTFYEGTTRWAPSRSMGRGRPRCDHLVLAVGSHPIMATYNGGAGFVAATSGATTVAVARAGTQVVLATQAVHRRRSSCR